MFRGKGVPLPYTTFDKDQRVTQTAVTENRRPGSVPDDIKTEQETAPSTWRGRASRQPAVSRTDGAPGRAGPANRLAAQASGI